MLRSGRFPRHMRWQSSGGLAAALLGAETQGLAIDFTDLSMVIRDTGTPANVFSGDPNSKLTYSSPSTKWVLGANGLYSSGTTLRTSYNASGTALGVLIEEARTNLCLQSNDLTNASWTKSNLTTAKTATGPDGVANSATTITASAGNATALQAITSGSAARITSVFLRRRTGTGNIDVTQDNGSTWATQSITSSWACYSITSVTSANPTIGIRVVTSGDAVDVAYFQHELGAFATSPIVTAGSTVTRAADNAFVLTTAFPFNADAGTYFVNGSTIDSAAATSGYSGVDNNGAGTNYMLVRRLGSAAGATVLSGGVTSASFNTGTYYSGAAQVKSAVSGTANLFKWAVNGASPIADDTSGAMPVGIQRLNVGALGPSFGFWNGHIKQILYLPRAMDTAELQALTT